MNIGSDIPNGALTGIKVVDLSRVLAGPLCSMILADHGARVIKIEPPQGDDTRRWGPPFQKVGNERGDASYFLGLNRNKEAISLDISKESGRHVLFQLLEDADILIENFKPGAMEKWGLSYEQDLVRRFPRLIHCRITGFGAYGPLGGLPGYDAVLQAMTGLMSINGSPSTGPMRIGTPIVDLSTGLYATIGVLMALAERGRSGLGQFVDMTLHDCGMSLLHPHAANFFLNGQRPPLLGNSHPNVVPCEKIKTSDGEIFLVIGNEGQFRRLVEVVGCAEILKDPRFATNAQRSENRDALNELMAAVFADKKSVEICLMLLKEGVPAGPVMQIDEAIAAEHTEARNMVVEKDGFQALSSPIKLTRTPALLRTTPPKFAAHTDKILKEHGFDDNEIKNLRELGVLPTEMK